MGGANACLDLTGVSGSRFLKTAKHGLGAVKQGRSAATQCMLPTKFLKTQQKGTGGSVFGPHRRERIAFWAKFGDARLGCLKKGLGHTKKLHFREKGANMEEAKTCLDRTGASGSRFLQSYASHNKSARNYIDPEGKAYVKD